MGLDEVSWPCLGGCKMCDDFIFLFSCSLFTHVFILCVPPFVSGHLVSRRKLRRSKFAGKWRRCFGRVHRWFFEVIFGDGFRPHEIVWLDGFWGVLTLSSCLLSIFVETKTNWLCGDSLQLCAAFAECRRDFVCDKVSEWFWWQSR